MTATTTLNPAADSRETNRRLPCRASGVAVPQIRPSGMATVPPAATSPAGPGQPTSRCSTPAVSAMLTAATTPMPAHCMTSRACPVARRYRMRSAGRAASAATTHAATAAAAGSGRPARARARPAPTAAT